MPKVDTFASNTLNGQINSGIKNFSAFYGKDLTIDSVINRGKITDVGDLVKRMWV